jgi:hypothetical protein
LAMGKPVIGICKLCLKTAELQESHIVSKFFWRGSGIFKTAGLQSSSH